MTNDLLLLEDDDVPLLWRGGLNSMEDLEEFFFFPKEIFSFIGGLEPGGMPFEEVAGTGAGWVGTVAAAPAAFLIWISSFLLYSRGLLHNKLY